MFSSGPDTQPCSVSVVPRGQMQRRVLGSRVPPAQDCCGGLVTAGGSVSLKAQSPRTRIMPRGHTHRRVPGSRVPPRHEPVTSPGIVELSTSGSRARQRPATRVVPLGQTQVRVPGSRVPPTQPASTCACAGKTGTAASSSPPHTIARRPQRRIHSTTRAPRLVALAERVLRARSRGSCRGTIPAHSNGDLRPDLDHPFGRDQKIVGGVVRGP